MSLIAPLTNPPLNLPKMHSWKIKVQADDADLQVCQDCTKNVKLNFFQPNKKT